MTYVARRLGKLRVVLFLTSLMAACSPIRGCEESDFALDADSRLPIWMKLPPGMQRKDVDVELQYWGAIFPVDNATFSVTYRGRHIASLTAKSCWHPATHWPMGGPVAPEPHYVILISDNVVDVAEHSRGNWKMTDDEKILETAKQSVARGECRGSPANY
jgi:hypothetical protein